MSHDKRILETIASIEKQYTEGLHYGKEYHNAKSLEELMYIASEPIGLSAIKIFYALNPPKRGELVLRLFKTFNKKSYNNYWDTTNTLSTNSILYVIEELYSYFYHRGVTLSEKEFDTLAGFTASFLCTEAEYSKEEREMFINSLVNQIEDIQVIPVNKERDVRIARLINRLGNKNVSKKVLHALLKETIIKDPLNIIEPHILFECYVKLK